MSGKKKDVVSCCDDLASCCEAKDFEGCMEALRDLHDCCDKHTTAKSGAATAAPEDSTIEQCKTKLNDCVAKVNDTTADTGKAKKVGFAVPPAVWTLLLQVGMAVLDELRKRNSESTQA